MKAVSVNGWQGWRCAGIVGRGATGGLGPHDQEVGPPVAGHAQASIRDSAKADRHEREYNQRRHSIYRRSEASPPCSESVGVAGWSWRAAIAGKHRVSI